MSYTSKLLSVLALTISATGLFGQHSGGVCTAAPAGVRSAAETGHNDYRRTLSAIRRVARTCSDAYVFIGGGSGAIISEDGLVITNDHVIRHPINKKIIKKWRIRTPRKKYTAKLLGTCPDTDLALLKIIDAKGLDYIPPGDSDKLSPGDQLVAIGNPFMLGRLDCEPTITVGIVSAVNLNHRGAPDAIMTDTPINPGNSGGPLINLNGELVGINGQIATRHGVRANTGAGYAISANQLKRFLPALKSAKGKQIRAGVISGLRLKVDETAPATVVKVQKDSRAAKAGFKKGDVFRAIEDVPVRSFIELAGMLPRWPAGQRVDLEVRNDGQARHISYKLDEPKVVSRQRPYVGLKLDHSEATKPKILDVAPKSPAARAGIKPGDIVETLIVKGMEPIEMKSAMLLPALLSRINPGHKVKLEIRRGEKKLTVEIKVGKKEKPFKPGMF